MKYKRLFVLLGDQLSPRLLDHADKESDLLLMAEVMQEASYVPHHKKKIAFLFSAMRHFAEELQTFGWHVHYTKLDDDDNSGSIVGEIKRVANFHCINTTACVAPGEWRLHEAYTELAQDIDLEIIEDPRFLISRGDFADWAKGRKLYRLEDFYRFMRQSTGLLMDNNKPAGGKWNYDQDNRKTLRRGTNTPEPHRSEPDSLTTEVIELVKKRFHNNLGAIDNFWFAVTRADAERALARFIDNCLPNFGDYQDAMLTNNDFVYHSVISMYLNAGLLDPLDICQRAENAYHSGHAPLNAVEGFIRQILGWREFIRGIYWLLMPEYRERNFFDAHRELPDFYWTAKTDMHCLQQAVSTTLREAYAHHIQRLMVTGNFALLAGINPNQVHEWYLSVYADAYEWVELPNTIGMSQFADGGIVGSKPYAASGNYINKMSDYCKSCRYDVKQKYGSEACPFNYLYWDFLVRNRDKLGKNNRLFHPYRNWDRMDRSKQQQYLKSADVFLQQLS
ncbi:MAG: cryptochrome/photolyase family protein [Pseudomonadota bacterium]